MHVVRLGHAGSALAVPPRPLDYIVGGLGFEAPSRPVA